MSLKKCLFVLSRLPFPPVGGDKLKSFNLVKILNKHYNLTVVVITDEIMTPEADDFLKKNTSSYKVFTYPKYRFYLNGLKGVLGNEPIQVAYYFFKTCDTYIKREISKADFVISNLIRTSKYVLKTDKPKFLDMVDSIGMNYAKSIENVKSVFWKTIYKTELPRIMRYEETCIKDYDCTFLVNKFESDHWAAFGNVTWIPNGVQPSLFDYNKVNKKYADTIVFLGKMDYQPNIDAVLWFINQVHQYINPAIIFYIVGTRPTKEVLRLGKIRNVVVTGFLEDPYEILNSSLAVIAPMQTGAGIQNKILEAMALRKVVITSSLGAAPIIGAEHLEHLIISDTPKEFANYINYIYNDKMQYIGMGENAKRLIQTNYTWNKYEESMINEIETRIS